MRMLKSIGLRRSVTIILLGVILFSVYKVAVYYWDESINKKQNQQLRHMYYSERPVSYHPNKTSTAADSTAGAASDTVKAADSAVGTDEKEAPQAQKKWIVQKRFLPLLKENKEVVGWIKIAGTPIDYPVAQTSNNDFYLTHDIKKNKNVNGSIFLDYRNHIKQSDRHMIVYGHEMLNKTMFYSLLLYASRDFFQNHSVIEFDTLYGNYKYKVFSAYYTTAKDDYIRTQFNNDEDFKRFVDTLQKKSLHQTNVKLSASDRILTLSTCAYNAKEGRFAVHAKLIQQ